MAGRKGVAPKCAMKPGETRNPNGRPKKGESLTEVMKKFLDDIPEGQTVTYKEMFVKKSYQKAYEGDPTFAKLVWNYIDGMPRQNIDVTSDGEKLEGLVILKEHADSTPE